MTRSIAGIAALLILLPNLAFARNPPPLRGKTPPDISGPPATDDPRPFPEPWLRGVSQRPAAGTSSSRHPLPSIGRKSGVTSTPTASSHIVAANPWLRLTVDAVPASLYTMYERDVSNAPYSGDEEPSIAMINRDGYTNTTVAWIRRESVPLRTYLVADRMRNLNATGSVQHTYATNLDIPTGYTDSVDPVLAVNPYTEGVRPLGMYLAGMTLNRDAAGDAINPQSIRVWVSSDAGATWDNTGMTVWQTSGADVEVDKPWIDVSWHAGSLGYVYVVFVEIDNVNAQNRIILRRSTNGVTRRCRPTGGGCIDPFDPAVIVHPQTLPNTTGWAQMPVVAVNPSNGDVAVLWVNGPGIRMRLSQDHGVTFGPTIEVARMNRFDYYLPNGLRAAPVPIARFNTITNELAVVWHDVGVGSASAVFYKAFNPRTVTSATMPPAKMYDAPYDQWQPSIDNDDTGNSLIAYYSTETDNTTMHPKGVYIDRFGNVITGPASLVYGNAATAQPGHVGDYHDVIFWSQFLEGTAARWNNAWGQRVEPFGYPSNTEVKVSGVQ